MKCGDEGEGRGIVRAARKRAGWDKGGSLGAWALVGSHLRLPRRRSNSRDLLNPPEGGIPRQDIPFALHLPARGNLNSTFKYVSATCRPEGWARVRGGEGAGKAYLCSPINCRHGFLTPKKTCARRGGGDEYWQRGGFGGGSRGASGAAGGALTVRWSRPREITPDGDKEPSFDPKARGGVA